MNKLATAFAAALAVCLISMYINYRSYQETHYLEWSYRSYGGEITIEFAPGWHAVHIYAMRSGDHDSHKLVFSPLPLIGALFVLTLAGYAVLGRLATDDSLSNFAILLAGFAVLFYGGRAIAELLEDYW